MRSPCAGWRRKCCRYDCGRNVCGGFAVEAFLHEPNRATIRTTPPLAQGSTPHDAAQGLQEGAGMTDSYYIIACLGLLWLLALWGG